MASVIARRLRDRVSPRSHAAGDSLRGVAFRLAAQTVALLLVMVVVLEIAVYVITQQTLLGSLENTLRIRASQPDPGVCHTLALQCGLPAPPNNFHPSGRSHTGSEQPHNGQLPGGTPGQGGPSGGYQYTPSAGPSDASAVWVVPPLKVIDHEGALGTVVLDPQAARETLRAGIDQCCGVRTYKGQEYLIYNAPLWANGKVVGAVQTSISEHQYAGTMDTLLKALLLVAFLGLATSAGVSAFLVRRAIAPIRAAVQRQRDFVADAAHELRTPLAIMRTVAEVGLNGGAADDQQAVIEQMLGQNRHLTRLVDDLSLLARTDTNTVAIERHPVDLSALVTDVSSELEYLAQEEGVTLDADVEGGIPVTGDILRLRQLLLILLDNALKHTSAGGTIRVRLAGQNGRARLQVVDSGPGIPPSDLSRIFDRFYQTDEARTGPGSGLGLAIGKWIVEAHGGQIVAGNASPHGAIFTVTFPMTRVAVPA